MSKDSEVETLKAWCHWKRKEDGASEDDVAMVKTIEDVISQAGTWKAKNERTQAKLAMAVEEAFLA